MVIADACRGVPKLINYLSRLTPARYFDDYELAELQRVYNRARELLTIDITDPRRERLAILIFQEAASTNDASEILSRVIARFARLD